MISGTREGTRFPVRIGILGFLLLGCSLIMVAVAAALLMEEDQDRGNRLVYGLTLNPSGFDPHLDVSNELGIPFFSVYDTLVYRHPQTMAFVPGLAERWEISEDGLVYTFYLRRGVMFHDDTPFDAEAVAANLNRIMNPENASGKARFLLGPYSHYEILDAFTIQLILTEPFAPLLDSLSQVYLGMASPTALAAYTKNTYQWHQVGTGPFMLDEVKPGDRIVLRRNPDYAWGPVFYAGQTSTGDPDPGWEQGALDTVEYRFYTDPPTRRDALESGEVQVIGELLPTDAELLAGSAAVKILRVPIAGTPQQFFLNTQQAPTDELVVRQALLYATNRTAIVDAVFQGESPVAYGPLTSVTPFYTAEVADPETPALSYPYSPDYARDLLASVGFDDADGDGMLERNGEPLKLTMVFAPWNQMADVAQLIQSQWQDIGIDLELIQVADFPTLSGYASEGNYHLIALYDFAVDANVLNTFYRTDGARNWSGFSDPEVDQWLTEAVQFVAPEERSPRYAVVQKRIMEQAVVLPIREYVNLVGTSAQVDGVIFSAQGWWPLLRNFQYTR